MQGKEADPWNCGCCDSFLTVAQAESISAAAEVLHVTQPTLSRQLMELEAELGTKLFARGRKKRRMALTEAGSRLRWQAEEILALADKTLASFQGGTEEVAGEVAIGGGESRAMALVARAFQTLHQRHPGHPLPPLQRQCPGRDGTAGQGSAGLRRAH